MKMLICKFNEFLKVYLDFYEKLHMKSKSDIFNLDQKFQSWNCLLYLLWCKTSLNQPKNSSVDMDPSKIDFSL